MKVRRQKFRLLAGLVGVLAIIGAASAGAYRLRQIQPTVAGLPVAPARKGDFLVIIRCRGELKAGRSAELYAPVVPNLRISWLASPGEVVQQGQPVIKFDSSSAEQQLVQKEAALRQAQATLDQAIAQEKTTAEQDASDLADAKARVETARLEASKAEIVSRIQGEENQIDLGIAEQSLKREEAVVALHVAASKARIASVTRQLRLNQADVDITKTRLAQMVIRAPLGGFVVIEPNYNQWPNTQPFREGDNVFSGMNLAEMPDLSTLMMDAKVEEIDRGRIAQGNAARIHIDALPELDLPARINQISPMAELGIEMPPTRSFRAYAVLPHPDSRLRPGMNGGVDIVVNRIANAISIPAKALFTRAGKPFVYLAGNGNYKLAEVQVQARNPDEVAVSGIPAGAMVALADPNKGESAK
ncbi:MAG TPA: efflux RND transporter periplasmic adaptor subunit [Bryobacterales bacterium]|nr:efflux RND transporter periplasmic adaptor subunit [Bryobacterales bacterium]